MDDIDPIICDWIKGQLSKTQIDFSSLCIYEQVYSKDKCYNNKRHICTVEKGCEPRRFVNP